MNLASGIRDKEKQLRTSGTSLQEFKVPFLKQWGTHPHIQHSVHTVAPILTWAKLNRCYGQLHLLWLQFSGIRKKEHLNHSAKVMCCLMYKMNYLINECIVLLCETRFLSLQVFSFLICLLELWLLILMKKVIFCCCFVWLYVFKTTERKCKP